MDFEIPAEITATLAAIDEFIEREIKPLEQQDDNIRFFDHRREYARTDFEADGVPRADWEDLLREMRRRADAAHPDRDEWVINGQKRFNSGLHHATHDIVFARTSGEAGSPFGITAFLVPTDAPGFNVDFFWWTFNMPADHAEVSMHDVRVG